jgi:CHAT domain-containing protein/Tfp pilus assembly protein PilF
MTQRTMSLILIVIVATGFCGGRGSTTLAQSGSVPKQQDIDRLLDEAEQNHIAGHFVEMERVASEAVAASRSLADPLRTARSLMSLGVALFFQSRIDEALAAQREGEALAAQLGDRALDARLLNGIGLGLRERGDYERAADFLSRALAIQRELGNQAEQSRILRNVAMLHYLLGDFAYGEDRAREAYDLARTADDPLLQAVTLEMLGNIQNRLGNSALAVQTFRRALAMPASAWSPAVNMEVLLDLSITEQTAGHDEDAITDARRVLEIEATLPSIAHRAEACMTIGAALFHLNRLDESLEWLLQSRAIWQRVGEGIYPSHAFGTELWIARVLRAKGQLAESLAMDLGLVRVVDRYLTATRVTELSRATAWSATSAVFVDTISLLFAVGRVQDAFDVSEQYRARVFLETLAESHSGAAQVMSSEQRRRQTDLSVRASAIQKELWDAELPPVRRQTLERSLLPIDEDLDALRLEVRRTSPQYANLQYPDLVTAGHVANQIDQDTVLISYVLGDGHSFVWAISRRGLESAWLPDRAVIERDVAAYRQLLTSRSIGPESAAGKDQRRTAIERAGRALYRTLLSPIEGGLRGATRLIIAPDGVLHVLPFEALIRPSSLNVAAGPRWLVRDFSVSEAPSASALEALAASVSTAPRSHELLAVGDPSYSGMLDDQSDRGTRVGSLAGRSVRVAALPFARLEVTDIAALYPPAATRVYLGKAATEQSVKSEALDQYRYIHFAAHTVVDDVRPGRSGILLSIDSQSREDGILQADEVMDLRLNADLVTLSACSTGLGMVLRGEGIVGLTRAFLTAGARSVAASLWNVNDGATAALMRTFYQGLDRGLTRDDALRQAKLSLITGNDAQWQDPYYWAPFVLVGLAK